MCWALGHTQDTCWAKPGQVPDFWSLTGDTDISQISHRLLVKESHGKAFLLHAFATGSKWPICSFFFFSICSFLWVSFKNPLCILHTSPLLAMWFANNLSQSVMCLFFPLIRVFCRANLFSFNEAQFIPFSLCGNEMIFFFFGRKTWHAIYH